MPEKAGDFKSHSLPYHFLAQGHIQPPTHITFFNFVIPLLKIKILKAKFNHHLEWKTSNYCEKIQGNQKKKKIN